MGASSSPAGTSGRSRARIDHHTSLPAAPMTEKKKIRSTFTGKEFISNETCNEQKSQVPADRVG
jgi:hypothetical protein